MAKLLEPDKISPRDVYWLIEACDILYTGTEPKDLFMDALKGKVQLWSCEDGVIVTSLVQHPAGKEFILYTLAGKNMITNLEKNWTPIKSYAKKQGCKWITAYLTNERLRKFATKLGLKTIQTVQQMEL
jgi:hypothetical protein